MIHLVKSETINQIDMNKLIKINFYEKYNVCIIKIQK